MVDALHLLTAYPAKIAFEPALIDGTDLLQKQCGIGAQHIGGYRHMYRQSFFVCFAVTAATMVVGLKHKAKLL